MSLRSFCSISASVPYTCCLCFEIVTLEDCVLERWRDFFANLHFDSRNSAFHRPCNPAHHPTFGTQKNRKKRKNVSKRSSFFCVFFSRFGKTFPSQASFSCQDVGSRVHTEMPSWGGQPKVWVNLTVSQNDDNCKTNIASLNDSRLRSTPLQFSGNETFLGWFQEALVLLNVWC